MAKNRACPPLLAEKRFPLDFSEHMAQCFTYKQLMSIVSIAGPRQFVKISTLPTVLMGIVIVYLTMPAAAQQSAIVQPVAPGQPTRILHASTRGVLPPRSAKDVESMQVMIMHHAQA